MNCFTYALRAWRLDGGYLLITHSARLRSLASKRSLLYWVPHFLHMSDGGIVTEYVPTDDVVEQHKNNKWLLWLQLWSHKGRKVTRILAPASEPLDETYE